MICPDCGADNATGAEWCTRCQFRFGGRRGAPPPPSPVSAVSDEVAGNTVRAIADPDDRDMQEAAARPDEEMEPKPHPATVTQLKPASPAPSDAPWGGSAERAAPGQAPVRPGAIFPTQSQATSIDPSWVSPSGDYGLTIADEVTRVGRTSFRFIILGSALLLLSAALPTIVYSVVNIDGSAVTGLLYLPLDVAVAAICGIVAPLGRKRTFAIVRLAAVGLVLVATVAFRYMTYNSIAVSAESAGAQSVRLGPGWYLMVLGGAALGVAWLGAVRGRLE